MGTDFELSAKVVLVGFIVAGQVLGGLAVAEQNTLACLHGFALTLKPVVGVQTIDHPHVVVRALRVHAALLVMAKGRVRSRSMGHRADSQFLFVKVAVRLQTHLLPEAHN